ncbi:U8 snoRNA-decapping enzyme [Anguilla anguilla]|uniref:U8 snoRNA-decapping enzyme n=1 Tax=Anguilla anguilla TaxID=7936 RepID=UPI0015A75B10|nr:U8 snoRNA-decapping enzyme [Anguilla anguilla]
MAGQEISKDESLSLKGYRHACHVMIYADTEAKLFGKIPIKHIVLMQMRFDGFLGFPGGIVNPREESLEAGLSRELWEEIGMALKVGPEDHCSSCLALSPPDLVTHFYTKKLREEEVREVERAAVSSAADHGLEVMGMVRVPLYCLKKGEGFPSFLSNSFIDSARSQLLAALRVLGLLSQEELEAAVATAKMMRQSTAH